MGHATETAAIEESTVGRGRPTSIQFCAVDLQPGGLA